MTVSTSRLSYNDAEQVFNKAMDDPKGIRIAFDSQGEASYFRLRLHKFRQLDRDDNAKIQPPGHPMHGRSTWDVIRIRVLLIAGIWYVYCEPINDASRLEIENLSELDEEINEANVEVLTKPTTIEMPKFRRI